MEATKNRPGGGWSLGLGGKKTELGANESTDDADDPLSVFPKSYNFSYSLGHRGGTLR